MNHISLKKGRTKYYAPINIMPHYPPYGQKAGNIGALTKGGCPYSRAFDYLWRHLEYGNGLRILHSYTACVKSTVIPHLLQGDLIIGYVPYIGAIDMQINQIPTLPHYSPYRG